MLAAAVGTAKFHCSCFDYIRSSTTIVPMTTDSFSLYPAKVKIESMDWCCKAKTYECKPEHLNVDHFYSPFEDCGSLLTFIRNIIILNNTCGLSDQVLRFLFPRKMIDYK